MKKSVSPVPLPLDDIYRVTSGLRLELPHDGGEFAIGIWIPKSGDPLMAVSSGGSAYGPEILNESDCASIRKLLEHLSPIEGQRTIENAAAIFMLLWAAIYCDEFSDKDKGIDRLCECALTMDLAQSQWASATAVMLTMFGACAREIAVNANMSKFLDVVAAAGFGVAAEVKDELIKSQRRLVSSKAGQQTAKHTRTRLSNRNQTIRDAYNKMTKPKRDRAAILANRFGVSASQIRRIIAKK